MARADPGLRPLGEILRPIRQRLEAQRARAIVGAEGRLAAEVVAWRALHSALHALQAAGADRGDVLVVVSAYLDRWQR